MRIIAVLCLYATALPAQQKVDKATIDRWMDELSNWGRWGKTDQMGTVNLITPAKRRSALTVVKDGISVSLSRDADTLKSSDNANPFGHQMLKTGMTDDPMFAMDTYTINYHGLALTHFDSLSHMFYRGKLYNGYLKQEIDQKGAHQLAVTAFKNGFITRGLLMDIPRLKGVKYLELSTPIMPADLEAWEKKAGIKAGPGDVVFIRTGRWARRIEKGAWNTEVASAGLHPSCARWFRQRDVAMIGADNNGELMPSPVDGIAFPIHQLLIVAMGMPMFDNCDLEAVGERAAVAGRWEFSVHSVYACGAWGDGLSYESDRHVLSDA